MINENGDRIYEPGDVVWFVETPRWLADTPTAKGYVHHSFMVGPTQLLAILVGDPNSTNVVLRGALQVWDEKDGLSNYQKQMKHPDSQAFKDNVERVRRIIDNLPQ